MKTENLDHHDIGHFGFSAIDMEQLGASEYTIVTIVCDRSWSTKDFQHDMEAVLKEVVKSCAISKRSDNLLLRVLAFSDDVEEVHGFKLFEGVNPDDYDGALAPGCATALYDAVVNAVEGTSSYAGQLVDQDYDCNAILFVLTDGDDNRSTNGLPQIEEALKNAIKSEDFEGLESILIGVNVTDPHFGATLQSFQLQSGFTQYVELKDADKSTLAKLANFVSQSISSKSQNLNQGSGSSSVSASITF